MKRFKRPVSKNDLNLKNSVQRWISSLASTSAVARLDDKPSNTSLKLFSHFISDFIPPVHKASVPNYPFCDRCNALGATLCNNLNQRLTYYQRILLFSGRASASYVTEHINSAVFEGSISVQTKISTEDLFFPIMYADVEVFCIHAKC
jgi:hypothetical protein